MTHEAEKANSLMTKYRTIIRKTNVASEDEIYLSQQCALIAVEEIMGTIDAEDHVILYNYWQEVKEEIKNL